MSTDAPVVWRLVGEPSALTAAGLFVVEGRGAIQRLLETRHEVVSLLLTPAARVALSASLGSCRAPIAEVTPAAMREVTGFNFHRGALALVRRPPLPPLARLLEGTVTAARTEPPTRVADQGHDAGRGGLRAIVVAEHVVDVDNVGSCFRNARAFGAACVLLDDRCADPLYRKAVRTSMGTVLEMPWTAAPIDTILEALEAHAVTTIGLTPAAPGIAGSGSGLLLRQVLPIREAIAATAPQHGVALLVGNEGEGLSRPTLERCTYRACIPMAAGADSLNVATALAVALYELARHQG